MTTTERGTQTIRVDLRRTGAAALRDALVASPLLRDRVTVTNHYALFRAATPADALRLLDQLREPLAVTRGKIGHPYASLHAVRHRLQEQELRAELAVRSP